MTKNERFRPDQIEKIKELGSRLQQRRQELSLSLDQVATQTRISSRLLQAIEDADLDVLPQSVYLKGLLKRYADALALNGTQVAQEFPLGDILEGIKPSWQNVPSSKRRFVHLYFVYVLALVSAISGLSYLSQRPAPQIGETDGEEPKVVRPVKDKAQKKPTVAEAPSASVTSVSLDTSDSSSSNSKPVVVDITLKDDCWLQIVSDGKTTFEGILSKGEQRTWEANEELVIRAGNAGGVEIAFNNEQAKPLGEPGAVETVTYQAPSPDQSQGG